MNHRIWKTNKSSPQRQDNVLWSIWKSQIILYVTYKTCSCNWIGVYIYIALSSKVDIIYSVHMCLVLLRCIFKIKLHNTHTHTIGKGLYGRHAIILWHVSILCRVILVHLFRIREHLFGFKFIMYILVCELYGPCHYEWLSQLYKLIGECGEVRRLVKPAVMCMKLSNDWIYVWAAHSVYMYIHYYRWNGNNSLFSHIAMHAKYHEQYPFQISPWVSHWFNLWW